MEMKFGTCLKYTINADYQRFMFPFYGTELLPGSHCQARDYIFQPPYIYSVWALVLTLASKSKSDMCQFQAQELKYMARIQISSLSTTLEAQWWIWGLSKLQDACIPELFIEGKTPRKAACLGMLTLLSHPGILCYSMQPTMLIIIINIRIIII